MREHVSLGIYEKVTSAGNTFQIEFFADNTVWEWAAGGEYADGWKGSWSSDGPKSDDPTVWVGIGDLHTYYHTDPFEPGKIWGDEQSKDGDVVGASELRGRNYHTLLGYRSPS